MSELRDLYQEVILDHNRAPRNFHVMEKPDCCAQGINPLCGDQLTLYLKVEKGIITEVSFTGKGCAISTASASLLTEAITGKSFTEAEKLFERMHIMLTQDDPAANDSELGKLTVLAGVKVFPARVKCATLAWHTLHAALQKQNNPVSTE
jgi:nitrogen fixation protein NifU and related proteins